MNDEKKIVIAPNSGFCFGVKRAVDKTKESLTSFSGENVYSYGEIIHNKEVVENLKSEGLQTINTLSEVENEKDYNLIIRAHGVGREVLEKANEKAKNLINATCPYVAKIQKTVFENKDNWNIVIVGKKEHPEVIGINGWCDGNAIIVRSVQEFKERESDIKQEKGILLVAQTTIQKEIFDEVATYIKSKFDDLKVMNTICKATSDRQRSCLETAKKVECMIVIGDKSSANSRELFEIAKKNCKNSIFVEKFTDLPLKEVLKYNKIGIAAGASTPDYAIEEVFSKMSEKFEGQGMQDFMEEIEKSLKLPRNGEMITGTIHQVTDKEIIVNLGCKKDGVIPLSEITMEADQKLTDLFKDGDEVQAKVIKNDDGDGNILLSRKKLEASEHWEEIIAAFENSALIEVSVVRQVNGGVIAIYKEVQGFIPLSQLSDKYIEDSKEYIGQTFDVRVTRVDQRRGKAVFSRKQHLADEKKKIIQEIWSKVSEKDIVKGKVMRFTDYGAFVDIGGVDGLLHISEISWGKLKHPKEVLSLGQELDVMILSMNEENGKISLGLKQTMPEPWTTIDEKYNVGDVVSGKVVQIKEYGCFIELEPGLDGLVHISEIGHKRVGNINDELKLGEAVSAKILEIDKEKKRISLSIKEITPVPTEEPTYDEITKEVVEADEEEFQEEAAMLDENIGAGSESVETEVVEEKDTTEEAPLY